MHSVIITRKSAELAMALIKAEQSPVTETPPALWRGYLSQEMGMVQDSIPKASWLSERQHGVSKTTGQAQHRPTLFEVYLS